MHRLAGRILMTAVLAACGGSDAGRGAASAATARDSAGIAVVENVADVVVGHAPVMATEPTVSIGEMDGPPEYQLYRVRSATRLSDGGLALFDGGSQEVRYYDASGRFVRRSGGKGGGPGEYQSVTWMARLPGDSLMLNDLQARRITVLASDGSVARSVNLAAAEMSGSQGGAAAGRAQDGARMMVTGLAAYDVLAPMGDGSLLARARKPVMDGEPAAGVTRDSVVYVRLAPDGTLRDTLAALPGDERQVTSSGSGQGRMVMIGPAPFGRMGHVAVDAGGFWFGSSDRYQLEHRAADGRLDRIVRRAVEPIAVTPALAAAARDAEVSRQADGPAGMRAALQKMIESRWEQSVIPATMPAHGALRTHPTGRLWVAEITPPGDEVPRWTAFDAEGRMLGTVTMPKGFRASEFGGDYVLGVSTDENGVERVELYTLKTPD